MRWFAAIAAFSVAIALLVSLVLMWFAPAPSIDVTEANTRILFSASQPITLGRCGEVRWQVGENAGIWVNGQGVTSEGTMSACIDRHFTRPQINILLPDDTWRLYELPVTSLIFSGATALTFTVHSTLAVLLLMVVVWLMGWRLPVNFVPKRRGILPYRAFALCLAFWLIFVASSLYLHRNTSITSAPAEAYITPTTIQQAWDSAERPITIPLIYKLLQNDFDAIAWLQWGAAIFSWSALAGVTWLHLRSNLLRVLACAVIFSLSLARDVYFWNSVLISESLSQSLFILLLAIGMLALWVYQRHTPKPLVQIFAAVVIFAVTVIWSFTRDTNSYIVLASGALLLAMIVIILVRHRSASESSVSPWLNLIFPTLLVVSFIALFVYQNRDADRGLRWRYPLMNVIARRVLPYPDNTAFFAERGMPTTSEVMRFAGQFAWAYDLTPIEPWLTEESRRVYMQYLLSDPIETFLTPINQWEMMLLFDYRVIDEHRPDIIVPTWIDTVTGFAYPEHLGLLVFSAVGLLLLALWAWRALDMRLAIVVVLLLLFYPLAFMVWYGDGFAVERHAVPTAVQWRLTLWLAIVFALDALTRSKQVHSEQGSSTLAR